MSADLFFSTLYRTLDTIVETQADAIRDVSARIADSIIDGGILHIFGSGHSHMLAEEIFRRAGGLAPVNAMLDYGLTEFHHGRASRLERLPGYAEILLDYWRPKPGDVIIVVSNSGINSVPVEIALGARQRGVAVIALTNLAHSQAVASRHASGRKLYEVADYLLDTCGVPGDASVPIAGSALKAGPLSTVTGAAILQAVVCQTAAILAEKGVEPPVLVSYNGGESTGHNERLLEEFGARLVEV